jgi:exonuclease III
MISKLNPGFVCISETHITENILDQELYTRGYEIVSALSHSKSTGGASILIRNDIEFEEICNIVEKKKWWLIGIKIKTEKGIFKIFSLYRSPSGNNTAEFLTFFENWLPTQIDGKAKILITGDFNINLFDKDLKQAKEIKNIFYFNGMHQLVDFSTRLNGSKGTLIDFVVTNTFSDTVSKLSKYKVADHETIKIKCQFFNPRDKTPRITATTDWKNFDYDELNSFINDNINFDENMGVNFKAQKLSDIDIKIESLLKHKVTLDSGPKRKPYYDSTLTKLKRARDEAYKDFERCRSCECQETIDKYFNIYKQKRNNYVSILRTKKIQFYDKKFDPKNKDSKQMWNDLKDFLKPPKNKNALRNIVLEDNTKASENDINKFFVDSIVTLNKSIPPTDVNDLALLHEIPQREESFEFSPIDESVLVNIVNELKSKSVPDNINLKVLLNCFESIKPLLLDTINSAITTNCFPTCWKTSEVSPIPKIKNTKNVQNLRPINILPLFEKILEIVLSMQITKYVEDKKILCEMQSGFRKSHSCETALQAVLSKWRENLDDGLVTVAVFLDFKRAFETIDRSKLIEKLSNYGFGEASLQLLNSFLSGRKQYVRVNNKKSDTIDVNIGVPQGSVLGPLLFILYINDLPLHLKNVLINIFADDTLLSASAKTYREAAALLNRALYVVSIWLKANKVKLNVSKTKCLIIAKSSYQLNNQKTEMEALPIHIEGEIIECVESIKYLGVIIDNLLKFDEHAEYVMKKVAIKISYLARISRLLSKNIKLLIYNCIVAPHFDYCASVMFRANDVDLAKLQVLQHRGMRSILNARMTTKIEDLFNRLGWLNIEQKIALSVLVLVKKIKNKEVPNYLCSEVQYSSDVHNYKTRRSTDFYIPAINSSFGQKSLFRSGLRLYNKLLEDIKCIENTKLFKKACILNKSLLSVREN